MSFTKGITARIEDWMVTTLGALTDGGRAVFDTCEVFKWQLAALHESFTALGPTFCLVTFHPVGAAEAREGDYDLRRILRFAVLIGAEYASAGVARCGDTNHLGASRIVDLVIAALDGQHPGAGFDCDDIFFDGQTDLFDSDKKYATELYFRCNRMIGM